MYIDPTLIGWLFYGAASLCGFMLGRIIGAGDRTRVIEETVDHLIENDFVKYRIVDDEIILIKKNEN